MTVNEKLKNLFEKISSLAKRKFWGGIEIKFENGVPVHLKIIENIKP